MRRNVQGALLFFSRESFSRCDSFANFNCYGLAIPFSALLQPCGKALRRIAPASLGSWLRRPSPVGSSIIKIGGICEIAHAETIQPFERTRLALVPDDDFDDEFLRVHWLSITSRRHFRDETSDNALGQLNLRNFLGGFLANSGARAIQFYMENIKSCL